MRLSKKMNTYRNEQYTITTSLNERTIHIKLVNNISYTCYEGNFDSVAFKLSFDIKDIFELVKRCFAAFTVASDDGFNLQIALDNTNIQLTFQCVVAGFLHIAFDLRMREKLMSNDAQLTVNFQRMEQTHQEAFDIMMKRMERMEPILEALGHAEICFIRGNDHSDRELLFTFPIASKELTIDGSYKIHQNSYAKIKHFYQLETLDLYNCNHNNPHLHVSNRIVKKLIIRHCNTFTDALFMQNFPNLCELRMESIGIPLNSDFVNNIRLSKNNNIIKCTFIQCEGINQIKPELQSYCTQNGIELIIA